ncbi:MAG: GerMN domain-containing protein [Treponema sp.]|nr:GerMN domain-containing protein [Treponema sp.]
MAKKKNSKNTSGLALACWILGFLVLLIIFLVKLDDIKSNLKSTHFFERVFGTTPTFIQNHEDKKEEEEPLPEEGTIITLNTTTQPVQQPAQQTTEPQTSSPVQSAPSSSAQDFPAAPVQKQTPQPAQSVTQAPARQENVPSPVAKPEPKVAVATTTAKLCFVSIDNDGSVSRKQISRTITKNDSPLTGNIQLLLAGPTSSERSKGCRSLIPEGTRLLSASVRDGVASLNFSEEFEYNRVGVEGYLGQLMQIVYTATEFSTVNSVQFLIDGQKKEYLGSEGVWIGSPLSRSSF